MYSYTASEGSFRSNGKARSTAFYLYRDTCDSIAVGRALPLQGPQKRGAKAPRRPAVTVNRAGHMQFTWRVKTDKNQT